ncbi:MAG: dual specificity protein phosphatase family protein [Gemmataceae bacterium]
MKRSFLAAATLALVVAPPLLYSSHRQTTIRNFHVVQDGVLYRSGQLTPDTFQRVLDECSIRTVVTMRTTRDQSRPYPDAWEETVCAGRNVKHVRLLPKVWGENEKGEIPADENVKRFLDLMADPANHPVLIHCFAGIHRTGTMCALFRIENQGWSADRAIEEMQLRGFAPEDMHEHIETYLRGYKPRPK